MTAVEKSVACLVFVKAVHTDDRNAAFSIKRHLGPVIDLRSKRKAHLNLTAAFNNTLGHFVVNTCSLIRGMWRERLEKVPPKSAVAP